MRTSTICYGVYRRGSSNAANALGPVAWATGSGQCAAERRANAVAKVAAGPYPWCECWPGQYFVAIASSRVGFRDRERLDEGTAAIEAEIASCPPGTYPGSIGAE